MGKIKKRFCVGEIFNSQINDLNPICFGENFKKEFLEKAKEYVIDISDFEKYMLKKYILITRMDDGILKRKNRAKPMPEYQFWIILYLLIFYPEHAKRILNCELKKEEKYIFHIKKSLEENITIKLCESDGKWYLSLRKFSSGSRWGIGDVFIYVVPIVIF